MMNKNEFMVELKNRLRKLPYDEINEAVNYYEEYFSDAGEENEQAVLAELGSPANISAQIIADYAIKGADTKKPISHGLSTVWLAILAVFASPIALPLGLAVVVSALAFVIVIIAVVFSIGAAGLGMSVGGLAYAGIGIPLFSQSIATALLYSGSGFVVMGVGLALLIATVALSKKCFNWLAMCVGKIILRRKIK
jgi:uncharacterized membrane protein